MARPRILLVPQFTELEWGIRPLLEAWADTASFDAPGVGDEQITEQEIDGMRDGSLRLRDLLVRRGLEEADRRRWSSYYIVGDAWSTAPAAAIAAERAGSVRGLALGHATVTYSMGGDRPAVSREVWAAMRQLLRQDHDQFLRHGIVQMTRGSVDDETAGDMIARFPDQDFMELVWQSLESDDSPLEELLNRFGGPLLLIQHVGCLSFTEEGFADATAAFPGASVDRLPTAIGAAPEFDSILRRFCDDVEARAAGAVSPRAG